MPEDLSKQIALVLRLSAGDTIVVLDGTGREYEVELDQMIRKAVTGKVVEVRENHNEPTIKLTLFQALLPREKFEVVLQKGTEVGVSEFVPVETRRSLIKASNLKDQKLERWQRIVKEAAEQSERGIVPKVREVLTFEQALEEALRKSEVLVAWEEQCESLKNVLQDSNSSNFSLFIGSEGGFEQQEIDFAVARGAKLISLGPRVLRAETAGIVASALVLDGK